MKFVAKELKQTADISRGRLTHRQILKNCAGMGLVFVTGYIVLGWAAGCTAARIPPSFEKKIGALVAPAFATSSSSLDSLRRSAANVLERLIVVAELPDLDYEVVVLPMPEPNAFALPGGTIALTKGLFDILDSEESLAMVLGHELGHLKYRHHMKVMGRRLLIVGTVALIFSGGGASTIAQSAVDFAELSYGRKQEERADEFGLELLVSFYGHAGGATTFFDQIHAIEEEMFVVRFLATHPASRDRSERLNALIRERGYDVLAVSKKSW